MADTFQINLEVEYHQQDTICFCGPTVAMMILNRIDDQRGHIPEASLWPAAHNNFPHDWDTTPNGLANALNVFLPGSFDGCFSVETANDADAASERIVQALYHPDAAPIAALTGDCSHWVVVRGFNTDVEPAEGNDYKILGFWINDPTPVPDHPPIPHRTGDLCGTDDHRGSLQDDEYVCYDDWKGFRHFTGCPDSAGNRQFITVCANLRADTGKLLRSCPNRTRRFSFGTKYANTDGFLTSDDVHKIVRRGIVEHGVHGCGARGTDFQEIQLHEPLLVQRIDLIDEYYYLVPLRFKAAFGFARVDALHGTFFGVSGSGASARSAGTYALETEPYALRSDDEILQAVSGRIVNVCSDSGYVLREGSFAVHPTLVWRPCRESPSPYNPFYQINAAGRVAYVDGHDRIYSSLTDLRRGD